MRHLLYILNIVKIYIVLYILFFTQMLITFVVFIDYRFLMGAMPN